MSDVMVENAPESVDLEELLGMSDIDDSDVASVTKEENKKVEETFVDDITEPHITLLSSKVLEVLKVSAMISAAGENSFEGKVVVFDVKDGVVNFRLSDNKRNIEKTVKLLNDENAFEGFLAFSTSFLARIIKICGSTFSIIERTVEENKKYVLKINGGELHMDNIKMSPEKYPNNYGDVATYGQFSKANIQSAIKSLYNFASTSIKTGKNLDFSGNTVSAIPINSLAKITYEENYPNFRLSLTDCKILNALLASDTSDKVNIESSGKVFAGETFKFRTESYPITDCAFDSVATRMLVGEYAVVDAKHLSQITELSCSLDTSIGSLKFNYTENGEVEVELLTKRENSKIIIQGIKNTDLVAMESPVEIPASNLRGALSIFPTDSTLNLRVSVDGLAIESANTKVVVLGKGVGK